MTSQRLLPLGLSCLLLLCALPRGAGSATPARHAGASAPKRPAHRMGYVNGVPDTGQFLPDTTWLIRVGPRVTRARDFVNSYFTSDPQYRPGVDSAGRVQFMNSIIHKDVLGLTALAIDKPLGFEDRVEIRENSERVLANVVFQRLVLDSVQVSEDEIRHSWLQYGYEQHFRHIEFADRATAERVRHDLLAGRTTWTDALHRFSTAADAATGGDLGWKRRNDLDPVLRADIFDLRPGETSPVVEDRTGFHIVQALERRPVDPPDYSGLRHFIGLEVRDYKAGLRAQRINDRMADELGMTYDTANAGFAAARFHATVQVSGQAFSPSIQVEGDVPEFAPADTGRVLVRWKDGQFTLRQLLDSYSTLTPFVRPNLSSAEAVLGQARSVILEPYMAQYAVRLGLDKDPLAARQIAQKREALLVQHLYEDSVGSKVWVSKEERRRYYEQNKPKFFTYASVRFAAITRPSKASADSLLNALQHGASAEAILHADSLSGNVTGSVQTRTEADHSPWHKLLFEELRPGQATLLPPDKQGVYLVLAELSYDKGRQLSFDESESMIDESLQNQKADAATQALVRRLSRRYRIAARPELLMRVRLSDPTLD